MRPQPTKILALSLMFAAACGGTAKPSVAEPEPEPAATQGLQIRLTTVYVDDLDRALQFYTEALGFAVKDDVSNGGYRWITVTASGAPDSTELHLALDDDPAAKAFQEAMFQQGQPAVMFYTDDIERDHERIKARGAEFTMPPTEVMSGSVIATLNDTCGNLIQITELTR